MRTILLSSVVVVGCAVHESDDASGADEPVVLRHEGHDHAATPAAKPAPVGDAGAVSTVTAPANCANTYDAIQATLFDSASYGCSGASCHGTPGGHIDLRKGYSYDSLLGLTGSDAGAAHDHDAHAADAGHVHQVAQAEAVVYHDDDGASEEGGHGHSAHVIAGQPDQSVLYDVLRAKVEGTAPKLGALAMPLVGPAITKPQLEALRLWIAGGAPRTGFVAGTDALCPKSADAGN